MTSAIVVGQLATYRRGIDPVLPQPTEGSKLAANSPRRWYGNQHADPYSHVAHVGYAHTLATNTVVTADFTYSAGRDGLRSLNINPDHQRATPAGAGAPGARLPGSATREQVSNAGRGDATYVFDTRVTKFLSLGRLTAKWDSLVGSSM